MVGKKKFMFAREFSRKAILYNAQIFSPPKRLKSSEMRMAMDDLISRIVPYIQELEEERIEHKIRIEDKITSIQNLLLEKIKFSFTKVLGSAKSKTEVIVSFLALLELSKQRVVAIEQGGLFEEIMVDKNG
jgi:chromatin segregation and condensation protein Rec8/ScpA/Scc1 (kleisin family)